jgi:hypothetical protein
MSIFIIATDAIPSADYAAEIQRQASPVLGFDPELRLAILPDPRDPDSAQKFADAIALAVPSSPPRDHEIFILPAALEFNLWQRETLGQIVAEARRRNSTITVHHDDPDLCDPFIVDALAESAARHIENPRSSGILLAPNGCGDPANRAQSYRLMRLLWERLGVAAGEVAFVRHAQPFLSHALEKLDDRFQWILIPQSQFETETVAYARVILENSKTAHLFADPPASDPRIASWIAARAIRLFRERRTRGDLRLRSPKSVSQTDGASQPTTCTAGSAFVARVNDRDAMRAALDLILPAAPNRVIVKVTWHGYATGTYTDPAALDLLLSALPAPAIVVEGHTSSRNLDGAGFDWETEAQLNRAWIRQQDSEFLRRTGLAGVMARHKAQYINITECFWDEQCATPEKIGIPLHHPELAGFIPRDLLHLRGCPFISFAKIKGPTRLAISNLFGLIPHPLRAAWHGPNITHFARVCCDLAKLYGSLFDVVAINEGLYSAVRWDRRGLYRSRWGNYDLITDAGHLIASRNIAAADILAARLQGQEISRSAFFDVVRAELTWDDAAEQSIVPTRLHTLFV